MLVFCAAPQADRGGVQTLLNALSTAPAIGSTLRLVSAWPDTRNWPTGSATAEKSVPTGESVSGHEHDAVTDATSWHLRLETGPGPGERLGPSTALRGLRDLMALTWRLLRFRPDVVNLHFPRGQSLYFMLLKPLFRFRLLLSFHGSDLNDPPPGVVRLMPRLCRLADAATVVAEPLRTRLEQLTPRLPVTVIPNGVDTDFWRSADDPGDLRCDARGGRTTSIPPPTLIAVGRLTPVKGFDVLLRAMQQPELAGVRLRLAGEGPCRGELTTLARQLGVAERVDFLGHLPPNELRAAYRTSTLFVLASRSEGMPLTLLEALACGLPAVATDVGAVGEILGDGSFGALVAPDDPAALAAAIGRLLADPSEAAGRAARARAIDFGLASCLDAYVTTIRELP